jgi:hypothetical protein
VTGGDAHEDPGDAAAAHRVHLAGDRAVLVHQVRDDGGDELRRELVHRGPKSSSVMRVLATGAMALHLDVVLGALDGEHPGEPTRPILAAP